MGERKKVKIVDNPNANGEVMGDKVLVDGDGMKILNTKKRDRRTIEEIQKDMASVNDGNGNGGKGMVPLKDEPVVNIKVEGGVNVEVEGGGSSKRIKLEGEENV